jgi:hypothetical protein
MNAGLAKPILGNLVYSKTSRMGLCAFCNAQFNVLASRPEGPVFGLDERDDQP